MIIAKEWTSLHDTHCTCWYYSHGKLVNLFTLDGLLTHFYGALLVPYTRAYSLILGMYPDFHSDEHFLTFGATFFVPRDFFLLAWLFFVWRDFFGWCDSFFVWCDFFSLAWLFFNGATFFAGATFLCWRNFFCLARLFLLVRLFFVWHNSFSLAWLFLMVRLFLLLQLFFAGATFLLAQLFFAGATLFRWRDLFLWLNFLVLQTAARFIAGSSHEHV